MLMGEDVGGVVVADCYFLKNILKVGFFKKVIINIVPINVKPVATQNLSTVYRQTLGSKFICHLYFVFMC